MPEKESTQPQEYKRSRFGGLELSKLSKKDIATALLKISLLTGGVAAATGTAMAQEGGTDAPTVEAVPEAPTANPNETAPAVETETNPTEVAPLINENRISDPAVLGRGFSPEIGGYACEREGRTFVYREGIYADAAVMDVFQTDQFGTLSIETPARFHDAYENVDYTHSTQYQSSFLENNEVSNTEADINNGMHEFWLQIYIQAGMAETREDAEALLSTDTPIELHWAEDMSWARIGGSLAMGGEYVRQIVPSAGLSLVVLPGYYQLEDVVSERPRDPEFYPGIFALTRFENNGHMLPHYTYGFHVEENGRLVISFIWQSSNNAIDNMALSIEVIRRMGDLSHFVGENGRVVRVDTINDRPQWDQQSDWVRTVSEAFGMRGLRAADYPDFNDPEISNELPIVSVAPAAQ